MVGIKKIKINETFIIEALIIWFVFQSVISSSLLKYSNFGSVITLIRFIDNIARLFMIAFGIYLLSKRKIKKNFIAPLLIYALIVIITKVYNDSYQFLDALFVAFVFKNRIKKERLINLFFWTILISFCIVVLLYFAGIFPHYAVRRYDGRERMYLGFSHPNSLGYYIMILCFLGVLKIRDKIRFWHIALLVAASYFVYIYPNSYTSAISILLLAIYLLVNKMYLTLFKTNVIKNKLIRYGSIIAVPIIVIAVYWFVANASGSMLANETLRTFYSRFSIGSRAIQQYGIHLFGAPDIEFVGTATRFFEGTNLKYFSVDSFYIQILVKFGIIPSLFFFVYYISCIKACIRAKDADILVMLIIMAIYSINESMVLAISSSFLFIIASGYLWEDRKTQRINAFDRRIMRAPTEMATKRI